MKIYNYHQATKVFIGESDAQMSPLEPGVFIIPAHATTIPPAQASPEGYVSIWNGSVWVGVIDKRGVEYYDADGTHYVINEVGADVPVDCTLTPPPPTPEELAEISRTEGIRSAQETSGLKKVTVTEAENFIDIRIDAATTTEETVEALRTILKKMVPYLLR